MNGLSDEEIKYFAKLMLRYESKIKKDPKGYNFRKLTKFLRKNNITLDYKTKPTDYNGNEKNTIIFSSKGSKCVNFIRHIRNAFAHNNITKVKNTYQLYDEDKKIPTMKGSIGTNLLKKLIAEIENMKA